MKDLADGIHYWPAKSAEAGVVVLLHSSQSASSQWRELIQQLAGSTHVIAVDLLGYGKAPAAKSSAHFRLEQEIPRIKESLEKLDISQPVTLIGHSYGGALALKLAAEQWLDVHSLALYEPVSFHVLPEDSPGMLEIREVSEAMHGKDATECTRHFVDYWNQAGYFDALPAKIQGLMVGQAAKVALDFDALLNEPLTLDDYQQVHQPVLLLTGKYTRRSAKAVVRALAATLPKVQEREVAAGHMGPLTHPVEVNPLITDFIKGAL